MIWAHVGAHVGRSKRLIARVMQSHKLYKMSMVVIFCAPPDLEARRLRIWMLLPLNG